MQPVQFKNRHRIPKDITVVLHNTAVSRSVQPIQRDAVNNHHRKKWNFPSELNGSFVGYNEFCEPTGETTQERYFGEETIAQIGNNCDSYTRCAMYSFCMAGFFRQEKPTQFQVDKLIARIRWFESEGFTVRLAQHKDVATNRTCAEMNDAEIQAWIEKPQKETKDEIIARLEAENKKLRKMLDQMINFAMQLIKALKK